MVTASSLLLLSSLAGVVFVDGFAPTISSRLQHHHKTTALSAWVAPDMGPVNMDGFPYPLVVADVNPLELMLRMISAPEQTVGFVGGSIKSLIFTGIALAFGLPILIGIVLAVGIISVFNWVIKNAKTKTPDNYARVKSIVKGDDVDIFDRPDAVVDLAIGLLKLDEFKTIREEVQKTVGPVNWEDGLRDIADVSPLPKEEEVVESRGGDGRSD